VSTCTPCTRCGFVYPWDDPKAVARDSALGGLCPACFTGRVSPLVRDARDGLEELVSTFAREAAAGRRPVPRAPRVGICLAGCSTEPKPLMASGDCRACFWSGFELRSTA
jgi:hypothetical protein